MWTFQELGDHMNLTEAERRDAGIRTIGTVDVTSKQRKQARKVRDKDRKAAQRRAKGAKPHAESARKLKPWKAEGIGRTTYYLRRQKDGGTGRTISSTVNLIKAADELVPRPVDAGAIKPGINPGRPATSTAVPKKGQRLEISKSRHAEPVPPKTRKAA